MRVWVTRSILVREVSNLSLVSLDSCSIHHSIYFGCDYFPCFDAGWPSLTFLSLRLLLSLFYSSVSPYLIWFHSFLILLDIWHGFSTHTSYLFIWCVHSFIVTFRVGTPRSGTHDVFYTLHLMYEGYRDYIIGIFEPSFHSFLSPYYLSLRYVSCLKTTPRPRFHTLCLTAHTWPILEISRRLFLGAWWMGSWDDDLHWGIPLLLVMDFQRWRYLYWGIPHSSMIVSFGMMSCTEA